MAQSVLKNAGLLTNEEMDFEKTKTVRLASERVGKDLWHQVYLVKFFKKSGGGLEAVAIHDASMEECSMTEVRVLVISRHLK
ncbi:hypothetical protein [Granulicella sp. L46]|uniref:hypothetical protein n=1 Tax=Granulicella sp. L46 TaxID=1641865 RepID=UPI001C20846E|nr:hypothetical protein [Granulicella sp. L46]